MDTAGKITIFGRDHQSKGKIYIQTLDSPGIALGTSAGVTDKWNEDGIGASVRGQELVLAIADGHWGREASEIAISKAVALFDQSTSSSNAEIQARLFSLFEQVNTELFALAKASTVTPETTLIVCHIEEVESGKSMHWASFGDSYLFLLHDQHIRQLNTLYPRWLGYLSKLSENPEIRSILVKALTDETSYVGVAGGLESGIEAVFPGDIIFLCTDGLLGSDSEPDPSVVDGLKEILRSDLPLGARMERVIASSLERGEKDNVSCVTACI